MYNSDNGYVPGVPEDEEVDNSRGADVSGQDMEKWDYDECGEPGFFEPMPGEPLSSGQVPDEPVDTTYHFSKYQDNLPFGGYVHNSPQWQSEDEPRAEVIEPSTENRQIRPNYQYTEDNQRFRGGEGEGEGGGRAEKRQGKGLFAKVAAIAIVCSLAFGTAGGYLGSYLAGAPESGDETAAGATGDIMTDGDSDTDAPESEPSIVLNTTAVTDGVLTASQIYELATHQVVGITSDGISNYYGQTSANQAMGTGFVISADGYVVTNYHVISNSVNGGGITVGFKNGETYEAKLVGGYEAGDVALLKIEATGLPAAVMGDSNNITVGENIYVVGNALGEYDYTLTGGLVSGLDRLMTFTSETGDSETINMFQIDAAVNSGNSGGPVYNGKGEIIGIVTSKISSGYSNGSASVEGLGFAIPINDALSVVDDIQTKGYVEGSVLLNVNVKTVESAIVDSYGIPSGVNVISVAAGGAAETAGVAAKDIITKMDDTDITSVSDLKEALKKYSVGDTAILTIYRSGEYMELSITFTETETTDTTVSAQDAQEGQEYPEGYAGPEEYGFPEGYEEYGGSGGYDPFDGFFG